MTAAGLYIHIPFCSSRCSYCDFATGLYQAELAERYVRALVQEIRIYASMREHVSIRSILVAEPLRFSQPAQLERIIARCTKGLRSIKSEITLEINPGSATLEKLREFRRLGVNRASFGAQTFDDAELAKLGRSHTAADALKPLKTLRAAGFAM